MRDAVRVGALAAVFFALCAMPGPAWYDTAEFGAVAWRMGLSHPPGHPLHALSTGGWLRLPLADVAFRANLASALLMGLAVGLFHDLLRALRPGAPRWATFVAALIPAVMPAIWLQAVRAEVYALQLVLCVLCARLSLAVAQKSDARALPALAFVFGLSGSNHSLIGLAMAPLAVTAAVVGVRRLRPILLSIPAGLAGLATNVWLLLRARAGGEVGWGAPGDLAGLWATISAREWQPNLAKTDALDLTDNAQQIADYFIGQVGLLAALLLFAVLAWGALRGDGGLKRRLLACFLVVGSVVGTRFFYPFDPLNPDIGGYFAPAMLALLAAAWIASEGLPRWTPAVFPIALALAAPGFDPGGRLGRSTAEPMVRQMLEEVPPGGALVTSDYATAFGTWLLRAAEGARPDVGLVFRGQMNRDWYVARLATISPEWAARVPGFPEGFDGPEVRFEPGVLPERLGPLAARLRTVGLTMAVTGDDAPVATVAAAFRAEPAPEGADVDARRSLALLHAGHAELDLRRGAWALAAWHLERANGYAPDDPLLQEMAARLPKR